MKKAQAMVWNWALVIIAGAVILGFFVTFTVKYIDIQNMKDNQEIANNIYNVIGALQKSSVKTEMPAPLFLKSDLIFSCDEITVGNFASRALETEFVFAPEKMQTDKLDIWVQQWNYPFKITNLFYITSKEKTYYIVYDASSSEFVNSLDFPDSFNIQKTIAAPKKDQNSRVISFNQQQADVIIEPKENGIALIDRKEYPIFGLPLLYAAMFSDNYPCILDRLLKRFSDIANIYKQKADYLFAMKKDCDYSEIKRSLNNLDNAIKSKNYDIIMQYANIIEEQNNNLVSINCPPLY